MLGFVMVATQLYMGRNNQVMPLERQHTKAAIDIVSVRSRRGSLGVLPNLLYSTEKGIYIAFMEISSKRGSQKAPELPLDLTLDIVVCCLLKHSTHTSERVCKNSNCARPRRGAVYPAQPVDCSTSSVPYGVLMRRTCFLNVSQVICRGTFSCRT